MTVPGYMLNCDNPKDAFWYHAAAVYTSQAMRFRFTNEEWQLDCRSDYCDSPPPAAFLPFNLERIFFKVSAPLQQGRW